MWYDLCLLFGLRWVFRLATKFSALVAVAMAERVGIRSRVRRECARSYRGGQPPRRLPTRGTFSPRPPCSNPTLFTSLLAAVFRFEIHFSVDEAVVMAERVGFEPTVELPRQQFSRLPDSAALAPLRLQKVFV